MTDDTGTLSGTPNNDDLHAVALSAGPELYRRMVRVRRFEEAAAALYRDGKIPGFLHLSLGQEAAAVGATWPLRQSDAIITTHRGHGHVLSKGLGATEMFAELMGRVGGTCQGRGGSMHIADPSRGILGANGIVGAGLPIAVGAAIAIQIAGLDDVVVAFFGDGAISQGAYHEAMNLASLGQAPVIFVCENNGFAEFSATSDQHPNGLRPRAEAYGVPYHLVDGRDVFAVTAAMTALVEQVRAGSGPVFLEVATTRFHGHYEGDPQRYRTEPVDDSDDPLLVARRSLIEVGIDVLELDAIDAEIAEEIAAAIDAADESPAPSAEDVGLYVWSSDATSVADPAAFVPDSEEEWRTSQAIRTALEDALADDPRVMIAGIDVGRGGNVFGLTRGLHERFGDRVMDTPISETAIMGLGVGAAMMGMRPVVELMYLDFVGVCLDQLMNQAAKMRFMTGGAAEMALTIRTQFGAGRSSGAQHSQSLEALLAHIPGLKVVMPSTAADAYGMLRSAIDDPNPVVFIENRLLYERKGPKPPSTYRVPIGAASVVRPGRDLTVVSYSRMLQSCLQAADRAAEAGVEVEVIDLRTISPLDIDTILASVKRTARILVVHEAVQSFGVGAEIVAAVTERGFWDLDAPVARVGALDQPAPYAPELERQWLPSVDRIVSAMLSTARA